MKQVITRFAPSPTGFLHIGGARTALFCYLFARHNNGKFLLRIEDTDRERSTKPAIDAIIDGMEWLGLAADEPPIFQFSRAHRHAEVALQMIEAGSAYRCYVTAEELEKWRAENPNKKFRSPYREQNLNEDKPHVVRLKAPVEGHVRIKDFVKGEVTVEAAELDDMVLLRSDGTPTYMLAVVVDDHDMNVTHVIRGDDHFTNTFRQKLIYEAMGWHVPEFAHVPMILGADGAKLSKRHGALGVEEYRKMGYLPEAIRNYLLRLGWSHGDDEIISDDEAIKWFSLDHLGTAPARFDFEKLAALNLHYIKQADNKRLADLAIPHIEAQIGKKLDIADELLIQRAMPFLKERSNTIVALAADAKFLVSDLPLEVDPKAAEKLKTSDPAVKQKLVNLLTGRNEWDKQSLEASVHKFMEIEGFKMGQIGPVLRVLLTGTMSSPGIYDVMAALGKDEVLKRLNFSG